MEEGAQYCEEWLLEVAVAYKLCRPPSKRMTLEETLRAHVDLQHVGPFPSRLRASSQPVPLLLAMSGDAGHACLPGVEHYCS